MKKEAQNIFKKKFEPQTSYSLLGEDMFVRSLFPYNYQGNYVDVGSANAIDGNNTYFFYKNGWSGLLIDPLEDLYYQAKKVRERDITLSAAIKSTNTVETQTILFYKPSWPQLASIDEFEFKKITEYFKNYMLEEKTEMLNVPLISVKDIKEKFNLKKIDIVNIDIEMCAESIVVDFIIFFQPKVIIYEKNQNDKMDWENVDYSLISKNHMNNIIINNDFKKTLTII